MVFDNPGSGSISLGPRSTRVIRPRLIGGQNFTAADLLAAGDVSIVIAVMADGLSVDGLTFTLDPKIRALPHEEVEEAGEERAEDDDDVSAWSSTWTNPSSLFDDDGNSIR
jgi:hypothetical protein